MTDTPHVIFLLPSSPNSSENPAYLMEKAYNRAHIDIKCDNTAV